MATRILIGALLCAVVAGIFLLDRDVLERPLLTRTVLLVMALGVVQELVAMAGRKLDTGPGLFLTGGVALTVIYVPHVLGGVGVPLHMIVVAALLATSMRLLAMAPLKTAAGAFPESALIGGAILYAGGLLAFLDQIAVNVSLEAAYTVVVISKMCDVFGYFGGTLLGRKKIVPAISPKKTWTGTILGILASGAAGYLLVGPLGGPNVDMPQTLGGVIGLLLGAATFLGDLIASAFKRWAGVKDSASLIKEFGGFLDLVDGVLFAAPVAYIVLIGT